MPPTLILIRHGEAFHNSTGNHALHDPALTELGREQCSELEENLRETLPIAQEVELIITSPFLRTIETTLIGLDWLVQRGVPIEPDALWQENSAKPCDTGSDAAHLSTLFPHIDFSKLDPVYPSKADDTIYAFTKSAVVRRGEMCLQNLYNRKEKVIAVVSHSGFLRTAISQTLYFNADYRVFDFASELTPSGVPRLVEWELTEKKGGGMGRSELGHHPIVGRDFPAEEVPRAE